MYGKIAPLLAIGLCLGLLPGRAETPVVSLRPALATATVSADPDDPAIWVDRADPSRSLILGTNKVSSAEGGALYVFGLDGKTRQVIRGLDRPNNVDVEYGLRLGGKPVDIAVVTERLKSRLRIYRIAPTGFLSEIVPGGIRVFAGETGDFAAPMGIALYKRPKDGAVFAIVGRKSGPKTGYLWQYRLRDEGRGRITAEKVRAFGDYSEKKEIEAIAVDDEAGLIYYADEGFRVRIWQADPDHPRSGTETGTLARSGWKGDHEGIAIYPQAGGRGYILCTDQIAGNAEYHLYRRDTRQEVAVIRGGADATDGIEAVSAPLGSRFPKGILVTMNSGPKNFLVFDGRDIEKAVRTSTAARKPAR